MQKKLEAGQNTGLIIETFEELRPTDFFAGSISGLVYEVKLATGDWTPYLPCDEKQNFRYFDTFSCVTFSAMNVLETQLNFLIGQIPKFVENLMRQEGYLDEKNHWNFSDRYTAKMSGTTPTGNTLQKVADSLRNDGLLPERDWPSSEEFNRDTYFAEIPQDKIDKARKYFGKNSIYFNISYEWVKSTSVTQSPISYTSTDKELKHAPLQIATPVCPGWNSGEIVQKCDLPISHAHEIYNLQD